MVPFSSWPLVGNEGMNPQYTNVKRLIPSFPTKGQPVFEEHIVHFRGGVRKSKTDSFRRAIDWAPDWKVCQEFQADHSGER